MKIALLAPLTLLLFLATQTQAETNLLAQATAGDAEAQAEMGLNYRDGKGVERDEAEAVRWFRLAAEQGDARGQDNLGYMLLAGRGVAKNEKQALTWFERSAAQGNHWGLNNLGNCYDRGEGVKRDPEQAMKLWKKAVAAGSRYACISIAATTLPGASENEDWDAAAVWLKKGAEMGDARCASALAHLLWHGTAVERDRKRARALWKEHDPEILRYVREVARRDNEPGQFANVPVVHLHQGYNLCGPTAAAMAATSWGKATHPFALKRACPDSPFGTGTDWAKLVAAMRGFGLDVRLDTFPDTNQGFEQGMAALRADLDRGRVVLIDVVWPENEAAQSGHTMLATGYDEKAKQLILHDPAQPHPGIRLMPYAEWKAVWHSRWYSRTSPGRSRPVIRRID